MENDNLDLFKDQRTISATEAEGVTQSVFHSANLTRFVRYEIQIATFIRVIQVDGQQEQPDRAAQDE